MKTTAFCRYCFSMQPVVANPGGSQRGFRCETCGSPVEVHVAWERESPALGTKILCIDDDRLLLTLLSDALEAYGFRSLVAVDGPSGIEAAKKEAPDLILLDIMMPRMSGFEVCRQLRAIPALKDTPIILLTAMEDPNLDLKGHQVGASLSLHKPFDPSDVVSTIKQVLGSRVDSLLL